WGGFRGLSMAIRRITPDTLSPKPGAWPKSCALMSKTPWDKGRSFRLRLRDSHAAISSGDFYGRAALSNVKGHFLGQLSLNSREIDFRAAIHCTRFEMGRVVGWNFELNASIGGG